MVLSVFILTTLALSYGLKAYRAGVILAVALLPAYLIQAIQPGVGTDYYSYLDIMSSQQKLDFFLEKKEYLFYIIAKTINDLRFPLSLPI